MQTITLSQNQSAIVDDEDSERLGVGAAVVDLDTLTFADGEKRRTTIELDGSIDAVEVSGRPCRNAWRRSAR